MNLKLKGKIALVTGGSRGIGRSVVDLLAGEGAKVAFSYRKDKESADKTAEKVKKLGSESLVLKADISKRKEVEQMVKKTLTHFGRIDILVNNAGHSAEGGITEIKQEEWDRMMKVHLNGTFYVTQAVIKGMIKQRYGKVINVASFAGMGAYGGEEHYCTAKAGMIGFTKSLAGEVARYNINANAVSPGNLLTDMNTADWLNTEEKIKGFVKTLPFRRRPYAEDVGYLIVFLASDRARHITGVNINVSGGQYI